jgi:hypothetical protein
MPNSAVSGMVSAMTRPAIQIRNLEYRSYLLQIEKGQTQWQVEVTPRRKDLPVLPREKQVVRGWDEDEVIRRAKGRVDAVLEDRRAN